LQRSGQKERIDITNIKLILTYYIVYVSEDLFNKLDVKFQ